MATYRELQEQANRLLAEAAQQREREVAEALQTIVKMISEFEISLEELYDHLRKAGFKPKASPGKSAKRAADGNAKREPKYRNPTTGETWSGRGRAPAWIRTVEAKGKSRDRFLVK